MDINTLKSHFAEYYGSSHEVVKVYFAPGRVNLIGEHTDYNDGYVFPCALDYGTYLLVRKNGQSKIRFKSADFAFEYTYDISEKPIKQGEEWVNYPLGVIDILLQRNVQLKGMDFMYFGNIPLGSGLSSSASIELVTGFAINAECDGGLPNLELVKIGQMAENQFVGMNCGIMDQFAVGMGQKDAAMFLDCETLDYQHIPFKTDGYKIIISNTNKPRKLIESKYNERRSECEAALKEINAQHGPYKCLGKIPWTEFSSWEQPIANEKVYQRARHVVSECQRVLDAIEALKANNLELFGNLMNQSHDSLKTDYEVTGLELDTLVEEARKIDGVIGSRMTGAGFGGCTVSLVKENKVDAFIQNVGENYNKITGLTPAFYIADVGDGVKQLV